MENKGIIMNIGEKIKFLRKNILQLNQGEFARKLNVSRLTVRNWECGYSKPVPENIKAISVLTHVIPDFLVFDNEKCQLNPYGLNEQEYELVQNLVDYFITEKRRPYAK